MFETCTLNSTIEISEIEIFVKDGDEVVASEIVTLGVPGTTRRYELEITPERPEQIVYELHAELQPGEIIEENNKYSFLVDNSEKAALDVLYVEGHPRNEYKFIRRAVQFRKTYLFFTCLVSVHIYSTHVLCM